MSSSHSEWLEPTAPAPAPAPAPLPNSAEPAGAPFAAPRRPLYKRIGSGLVVAGLVVAKFAAKLKALIFLLPKVKLLTTSATMLVSIAAYSLFWGWTFAIGFVLLLLVHELGHVIALRREGVAASAPMFIPFMGAVVAAKSLGKDALAEARVGLAGPVLGTIGALACAGIALATGGGFWYALAFTGFFLNLFNLLPVLPLDGGRAMAAMAPWMWFVGFAALVGLTFVFPNPIMLLILLIGGYETYRRWKARKAGAADPQQQAYYKVSGRNRALVAAVYIGLIALLAVGMDLTHVTRTLG